jgi:exopolyphosphatase / guanosine-5'-triphosphate,3'-diphosphate pyrophosphatase
VAIVGRWEWRGFGAAIEAAERRLVELGPDSIEESDETYLLSFENDASVKVRDGLLDVKRLVRVSDEGLQQWIPIAKDPFPVEAAKLGTALAELAVDVALEREAYTLVQLHEEVVAPSPALHPVDVHKTRRRYTIGGCMAELTDATLEGRGMRTVAVESEDHELVLATLRELGLRPLPNVCVPRGLKQALGLGPRRFAVIDVGTNSVKVVLAERASDGRWRQLVDRAEVTRLGAGLADSGRLEPEPTARTIDAIAAIVEEARREGADEIAAVGTAGLRAAANSGEFLAAVEERCGIALEVISGEEEARLAYTAAIADLGRLEGTLVTFETGGGSTQFTFGRGGRIDEQFSVDVGAVRFTERFGLDGAVDEETVAAALEALARDLAPIEGRPMPDAVVGMGGGVTNLAAVKLELATYDPDIVRGTELTLGELDALIERFRVRSADERREIVGLQPKRAEVILAGACVVRTVLATLGRGSLSVSDRGLRHRLLVERFGA